MVNPWIFYLMSISDSVCNILIMVMGLLFAATLLVEDIKTKKKCFICLITSILLFIFIPSRMVCLEMLAANNVTKEKIEMIYKEVDRLNGGKNE